MRDFRTARRAIRHPGGWVAALLALALVCAPAPAGQTQDASADSLAGQLLVASPEIGDPRFRKSVILLVEHNARGAFGLMVNRPAGEVPWAKLLDQLGMENAEGSGDVTLYYGGPVQPRSFFLLYGAGEPAEDGDRVAPGIALTGRGELIRRLAAGEGPGDTRPILGYAGWSADQLENEMRRGDWFAIAADPALVFADDPKRVWARARAERTIEL